MRAETKFSKRAHENRVVKLAYSSLLALCLIGSISQATFASDSDDIGKLETKFFSHTYPTNTQTQRIERIEKFVYGDPKTGPESGRIATLMKSIPAEGSPEDSDSSTPASASSSGSSSSSSSPAAPSKKTATRPADTDSAPRENVSGTKYPAVTAIEQRVLKKSYETEPVEDRLARLETKVFGKPSKSADLSDRVDALKSSTGVDVANRPPASSDWSDDEDDATSNAPSAPRKMAQTPYVPKAGEDGMSFSGRDLRSDMRKAFGGMSTGGGAYGMGSGSTGGSWSTGAPSSSGAYGFGGGTKTASAPPMRHVPSTVEIPPPKAVSPGANGMGMRQQLSALENEIFGKNYDKETLLPRLARLELAIFPADKNAAERSLPDRVKRLVTAIPISNAVPATAPKVAQKAKDFDFSDDDDLSMPNLAPPRSSMSKIMNQLGSMMGNGSSFVGGYSMPSTNMVRDPSTGMLLDRATGNLIDPNTGTVVGRRVAPSPYVAPPTYGAPVYGAPVYGAPVYGGGMTMPPMNNGFAPYSMTPGTGLRGLGMP